jgi:hypothetical protein
MDGSPLCPASSLTRHGYHPTTYRNAVPGLLEEQGLWQTRGKAQ